MLFALALIIAVAVSFIAGAEYERRYMIRTLREWEIKTKP